MTTNTPPLPKPMLTIPNGVKLDDLPLETRIMLRLVSISERREKTANLKSLAKDLDSKFPDVRQAVEFLGAKRLIRFNAISVVDFEFELIADDKSGGLRKSAANLQKSISAMQSKGPAQPARRAPAHLPTFKKEQRAVWQEKAAVVAEQIGAPSLAGKIANCFCRIGEEEVNTVVNAIPIYKGLHKCSSVRAFFTLYTARRDELIKPT